MHVADTASKGEIDFEQFCVFILGMGAEEFEKLIEAHKKQPVMIPAVVGSNKKSLGIEELAPSAWARRYFFFFFFFLFCCCCLSCLFFICTGILGFMLACSRKQMEED